MWLNRNMAAMVVILGTTKKLVFTFTSRPLHPVCVDYDAGDYCTSSLDVLKNRTIFVLNDNQTTNLCFFPEELWFIAGMDKRPALIVVSYYSTCR